MILEYLAFAAPIVALFVGCVLAWHGKRSRLHLLWMIPLAFTGWILIMAVFSYYQRT